MKSIHTVLAVLVASLLVSAFSFAGEEPEVKRHMEIKIAADDEMVEVKADDLEIGETRQSFTESGKEVLVTRTEEGFKLVVDGRDIDVDMPHGEGHHAILNMTDGEDKEVVIHQLHGDGDDHGYHYIHADEGEDIDVVIERFSTADRLIETGVLDDLDDAKRQAILDTLREMGSRRTHKKVRIMMDKKHEEHGEDQ